LLLVMVCAAGCGKITSARDDAGATTGLGGRDGAATTADGALSDATFPFHDATAHDLGLLRDATTTTGTGGAEAGTGGGGGGAQGTGGSGLPVDAAAPADAEPPPDGAVVAGTGGASAFGTGGAGAPDGGVVVGGAVVLFPGTSSLLDLGPSCTGEVGATGDRWCAFLSLSAATGNTIDLYVVNVSRALAGTAISCGGSDPNCLLLTGSFAEPDNLHAALFQGDTLVYFDGTGTPWAWRPGMSAARRLVVASASTGDVLACQPSTKGTTVVCLRDLPTQTSTTLIQSDLLAGRVDATADPPLARIDTVISANMADTDYTRFSIRFPAPGSGYVAWSSRATASGPEILKVQQVDSASSRVTVATDVHGWDVSPDGLRWYWLSKFNGMTSAGTLQTAPFPGGAGPTAVMANAVQFAFPSPTSLIALNASGTLAGVIDALGAPTRLTTIDSGVIGALAVSGQGRVAYVKNFDGMSLTDLYVKKADGTGPVCTLSAAVDTAYTSFQFATGLDAAVWARSNAGAFDALYARLTDCTTAAVAPGVSALTPVADRAVMFLDQLDSTANTGSLRFRGVAAGGALGAGAATLISDQVGSFDVAPASPPAVIYTVNAGGADDGVYLRGF
jgi:hypothetical protein